MTEITEEGKTIVVSKEEWKNRQLTRKGYLMLILDWLLLCIYGIGGIAMLRTINPYDDVLFFAEVALSLLVFERVIILIAKVTSARDSYETVIIKEE